MIGKNGIPAKLIGMYFKLSAGKSTVLITVVDSKTVRIKQRENF